MIVVDDGSSDATADVAGAHPGRLPVEVISMGTNQGPGRAFDRGFRRALEVAPEDGFVVTLEADTTSDLDALGGMLELARGGADVVLASTHAPGGGLSNVSLFRRVLSRSASYAIRRTSGVDARTVSTFFRVYRASILRAGLRPARRRRSSASAASPARRSCSSSSPGSGRASRRCRW